MSGSSWIEAEVLVTVKAYPALSRSHGEVVCVAGIRLDTPRPEWIRLYPMQFRDLPWTMRFRKYQTVRLRIKKSKDPRLESYTPDHSSIELGNELATGPGGTWRARRRALGPLIGETTMCQIRRSQEEPSAPSLALIKPRSVEGVEITPNEDFSTEKQRMAELAAAEDLFGSAHTTLEPAPYRLRYQYACVDPSCGGHFQTLIDWEVGQARRSWSQQYGVEHRVADALRDKFLTQLCADDRDTYFFVGNQHLHPQSFMVLGVFWPRPELRNEQTQQPLFDL